MIQAVGLSVRREAAGLILQLIRKHAHPIADPVRGRSTRVALPPVHLWHHLKILRTAAHLAYVLAQAQRSGKVYGSVSTLLRVTWGDESRIERLVSDVDRQDDLRVCPTDQLEQLRVALSQDLGILCGLSVESAAGLMDGTRRAPVLRREREGSPRERTGERNKRGRDSGAEGAVSERVADEITNRKGLSAEEKVSSRATIGRKCGMETDVANDDGDESAAVLDESRIGSLKIAERDERAQRSDCKRAERPDAAKRQGKRRYFDQLAGRAAGQKRERTCSRGSR